MIDTKAIRAAANFSDKRCGRLELDTSAILALLDRLEAAETEVLEQARLLGIGGEKELALMAKLEAAEKDAARLDWLLTYLVSDDTSKDDAIIAASDVGVDQIKLLIDAAMKEQK